MAEIINLLIADLLNTAQAYWLFISTWLGLFAYAWVVSASIGMALVITEVFQDRMIDLVSPGATDRAKEISRVQAREYAVIMQASMILAPYTYGASLIVLALAYAGILVKRQVRQDWPTLKAAAA